MSEIEKSPDFFDYRGVTSSEIPNIDVYMDQLLTFFDSCYGFLRRDQKDTILTKAMINNYVKARVMDKPIKKKYNKKQIKKLIMIYHLKQVLAINDIQRLFNWVEKSNLSTDDFYEIFLASEHTTYQELAALYTETVAEDTDSEVLLNTIVSLTTEACAKKRLAEKLLDQLSMSVNFGLNSDHRG